jgi:hypothetical protein
MANETINIIAHGSHHTLEAMNALGPQRIPYVRLASKCRYIKLNASIPLDVK